MSKIETLTDAQRAAITNCTDEAAWHAGCDALRIIDRLTAALEAAERKAESRERGHDYAWAEKSKAESELVTAKARVTELEAQRDDIAELAQSKLNAAESELAQMRGRVERATCMLNGPHSVTAVIGVLRGR